jgi:hypothetical protein
LEDSILSIDSVFNTGDDALANIAEISITEFSLFGPLKEQLKFRTTQISVPGFTMGAYEVNWKSQKFEKPSGKDETEKTFTFTFRVDKYYTVYKALLAWWQYICNSNNGALAEDVGVVTGVSNIRTIIMVKTVDTQNVTTNAGFTFEGAWIKSLAGFSYDVTSGDPLECQVTMSFVKMLPQF